MRSLNATQVLKAYIAKAIMVQDNLNCITEFVPFALVSQLQKLVHKNTSR